MRAGIISRNLFIQEGLGETYNCTRILMFEDFCKKNPNQGGFDPEDVDQFDDEEEE